MALIESAKLCHPVALATCQRAGHSAHLVTRLSLCTLSDWQRGVGCRHGGTKSAERGSTTQCPRLKGGLSAAAGALRVRSVVARGVSGDHMRRESWRGRGGTSETSPGGGQPVRLGNTIAVLRAIGGLCRRDFCFARGDKPGQPPGSSLQQRIIRNDGLVLCCRVGTLPRRRKTEGPGIAQGVHRMGIRRRLSKRRKTH